MLISLQVATRGKPLNEGQAAKDRRGGLEAKQDETKRTRHVGCDLFVNGVRYAHRLFAKFGGANRPGQAKHPLRHRGGLPAGSAPAR